MTDIKASERAALVKGLSRLARPAQQAPLDYTPDEHCELCPSTVSDNHRHLLHLTERRIVCVCETCWSMRSGDPDYRPAGGRTLWLDDFKMPDELWAAFQIPIGLTFFMQSGSTGALAGLYPSPAGATECELSLEGWDQLKALNPMLEGLEPDCEALLVNRMFEPHQYVIAPIDTCYGLVGVIKANWEGISGGDAIDRVVPAFFADLRERARVVAG